MDYYHGMAILHSTTSVINVEYYIFIGVLNNLQLEYSNSSFACGLTDKIVIALSV